MGQYNKFGIIEMCRIQMVNTCEQQHIRCLSRLQKKWNCLSNFLQALSTLAHKTHTHTRIISACNYTKLTHNLQPNKMKTKFAFWLQKVIIVIHPSKIKCHVPFQDIPN